MIHQIGAFILLLALTFLGATVIFVGIFAIAAAVMRILEVSNKKEKP